MSSTPFDIPAPPSLTTVLVVRHTHVHNPKDILYGRLPRFSLSDDGRRQADAAARFLSTRRLSAIYTSPLLRARQTAQIISTYHANVRVRTSRFLLETRTGYQGQSNSILTEQFSFYEPRQHPDDESMEEIWQRMSALLRMVVRRHSGTSVVLVSHGDPITILRVGLEGLSMTTANLHGVVYAARSSITQLVFEPCSALTTSYFNVGDSADRQTG